MKNIKSSGKSLDDSDLEKVQGGITYIVEPECNFFTQLFSIYKVYDEKENLLGSFYWYKDAEKFARDREKSLGNLDEYNNPYGAISPVQHVREEDFKNGNYIHF